MDIKSLANTIASTLTAPVQYGANVNEGGGNAQVLSNIQNLGALDQRGDWAARATKSLGVGAQAQDEAEKAAARAAAQKAADDAAAVQEKIKTLSDPKNYQAVINDAGGYDFVNPAGEKISAVDYAKATNQHITDVYKNSQDPNDKDFVDDYKRVLELGKILNSGDKKARDKFYKENPDFKEVYANTPYNEIVKDLRNEYPGYFRSDQELTRDDNLGTKSLGGGADTRSYKQRFIDLLNPTR